ncbi:2-oxoglutarate dehydrogenase, E2 component, dihydrolipoamide succinyltransferase [Nocardioides montaniterrae]
MATEVPLPALGESVTEGTVTRWLKQVGDSVSVDEPLLEVSTDKVDTEIPSPVAGTLLEIKAAEDETVEVGAVLAVIGAADESAAPADAPAPEAPAAADTAEEPAQAEQPATPDEPASPNTATTEDTSAPPAAETEAPDAAAAGATGTAVTLPALGESVTEGTVTKWLKQVGDSVAVDEPLLEVSTDKVDTEIPSPVAGTLLEIKAAEDETVEVGAELAIIGSGQAAAAPAKAEAPAAPEAPAEPAPAAPEAPAAEAPAQTLSPEPPAKAEPPAPERTADDADEKLSPVAAHAAAQAESGSSYVTPLVRKLANQHGVDLSTVEGSGVGGRIRKQDVLAAAEAAKSAAAAPAAEAAPAAASSAPAAAAASGVPAASPSPLRGKTVPMSRLRTIIAKRMTESLQISAQLTQVVEIDVTNVARLRESIKDEFLAREGVKLSYLPFFAKAAIDSLKSHPMLNAAIDTNAGTVTYYDRENLSIAVDTEKGLITPVIKEAGDLSVSGLAKKIADVAERTRTNKIGPDELSGGTFTITNLGSVGALWDTPVINQPQVAILGPGAVVKRPVVIDDDALGETIAIRHMCYFALTYDHRLVDGADAGRFLSEVKKRLEAGQFEV